MKKSHLSTLLLSSSLLACSSINLETVLPDNRPDYKQSRTINPLEVPPDLTKSSIDDTMIVPELSGVDQAHLSDYQKERNQSTAQKSDQLKKTLENIQRSGDATWISISDTPINVFKNIKSFWHTNGLPVAHADENIGIIETVWLEKRSDLPRGGLMGLLSGVIGGLHDSGIRDKFRSRVDYDGKNTLVYITHYGATEEQVDEAGKVIKRPKNNSADAQFAFVASSRNPELEVEMLRRLNLYLIKNHKQSAQKTTADTSKHSAPQLVSLPDGTPALVINSDFDQAWVMLGVAIDRAGYELSGQDRRNGVYNFAKIKETETGFIIKHTERTFENFQLAIADQGNHQIVVLRSHNQSDKVSKETAKSVLEKLSKEVRF